MNNYEMIDEEEILLKPIVEELPNNDEINSLILATAHMTDYEMIDFVTDLYVRKKLTPLNYEAIEMEDFICEKDVVFDKVYDMV